MKITKKQLHELASECVLNFDYEKASLFYKILNIPWAAGNFPDACEVRKESVRLLTGLINYIVKHPDKNDYSFSCRGLKVSFDMKTDLSSKIMRLEFNALTSVANIPLTDYDIDEILRR